MGNPSSQPNPTRDAEVLAKYAPHGLAEFRRVDLAELARESDVVFVLAPGGPSTYHVVNEDFLKGMKKTAVLVNTSRGALVNSDALAKACREGWIWGAGIDVVEGEPNIPADHPLVKEPRSVKITSTRVGVSDYQGTDASFCLTLGVRRTRRGWAWPRWRSTTSLQAL